MNHILVTGASGFVGRALVKEFAARGHDVVAAVRQAGDAARNIRTVAIADIGPGTDWRTALDGAATVIHLAGVAHSGIADDPETAARYETVNVAGSVALARQSAAAGAKRLVFLSSVKVNGERTPPDKPFRETDTPAPEDIYGRSKLAAEQALFEIGRETGLEIVVLRSPLVHGPGVAGNLGSLLRLCDSPWPLPLGGLTENRRSLIGRSNLIDALHRCAIHPRAAGEVFLARDGEDISTADLARRLRRALGRPARLLPMPSAGFRVAAKLIGRPRLAERLAGSLTVDDSKLRERLDWQAPNTLADGLLAMAQARQNGRNS